MVKSTAIEWNAQKQLALVLIFDGRRKRADIAREVGVGVRTLEKWCLLPLFKQKLKELADDVDATLLPTAFYSKTSRIITLTHIAEIAYKDLQEHPRNREVRRGIGGEETVKESFNKDAADTIRDALRDISAEKGERIKKSEIKAEFSVEIASAKDALLAKLTEIRLRSLPPDAPLQLPEAATTVEGTLLAPGKRSPQQKKTRSLPPAPSKGKTKQKSGDLEL